MKKFLSFLLLLALLALPALSFAAGVATLGTVQRFKNIDGKYNRCVIPITFTADGAAAEGTYSLSPTTHNIRGWYLYEVFTDPGATGPSNGAWDLDITDAKSWLVSQNLIDDRSSTATQRVTGATLSYPQIWDTWSITIGDNAVNNAVAVVYLVFVDN